MAMEKYATEEDTSSKVTCTMIRKRLQLLTQKVWVRKLLETDVQDGFTVEMLELQKAISYLLLEELR